jgi:CRP-like cAMP-binding protein
MEAVDLPIRQVLVEKNQPTTHVYFLESGLGSIVASSDDEHSIEVGHVGREGMSASHIVLHVDQSPNRTFMQAAGHGLRVPVEVIREARERDTGMRVMLLRYVHYCEQQFVESALANGRYSTQQRLARWILMCHDRLDGDELPVTHEFLALMLGVRRSGVTNHLHVLEGEHAIKSVRGRLTIVSREKLEELASGCYGLPERIYERLLNRPVYTRRQRALDLISLEAQNRF